MSDNNWSRWYREGTVKVINGSKIITGTDTYWLSAGLHAGDIFSLDGVTDYEIDTVTSNTQLTLRTAFGGASTEGASYSIVRNFTATLPAEIAAKTAGLIGDFSRYIDTDMQSIHGKSAYEIAKANGYAGTEVQWLTSLQGKTAYEVARDGGYSGTQAQWLESLNAYGRAKANGYSGTESQWLESLKAAGEWSALDTRTTVIEGLMETGNIGLHNSLYRGKDLGNVFTDEMKTAIRSGAFTGMYLGDWICGWEIWGFDYFYCTGGTSAATQNRHHVLLGKVIGDAGWINMNQDYQIWTGERQTINGVSTETTEFQEKTAYVDSHYYTYQRPKQLAAIAALFGEDHMYKWNDISYTCNANGHYTGNTRIVGQCEIPHARQLVDNITVNPYQDANKQFLGQAGNPNQLGHQVLPIIRANPAWLPTRLGGCQIRDLMGVDCYGYGTGAVIGTSRTLNGIGYTSQSWGNMAVMTAIM